MARHALTHHEDWGWRELHDLDGSTWTRRPTLTPEQQSSRLLWRGIAYALGMLAISLLFGLCLVLTIAGVL